MITNIEQQLLELITPLLILIGEESGGGAVGTNEATCARCRLLWLRVNIDTALNVTS